MVVKDKQEKDPELRKADTIEATTVVSRSEGFDEAVTEPIPDALKDAITKTMKFPKYIRQPDVALALDSVLAETIKDFEKENAELYRKMENNNMALAKLYGKILSLNGLSLRHNTMPSWKQGEDFTLLIPVPDEPMN